MIRICVLVMLVISSISLTAQTFNNTETQKIVDHFFKTYKEKGHEDAVKSLLGTNKWISEGAEENISNKLNELIVQIGEYHGFDKIKESKYGDNIIQYTYLVRYERQPLRFLFRFYRPNDKWQTQGFEYEVEFLDELNEPSKADKLRANE